MAPAYNAISLPDAEQIDREASQMPFSVFTETLD
jgi:hypothetical protein